MIDLTLARHGQSYGNLDRSLGPDTDLTDLGREQATRLGAWLAVCGPTYEPFRERVTRATGRLLRENPKGHRG